MTAPHLGSARSDTGLGAMLCDHEAEHSGCQHAAFRCASASCPSRVLPSGMAISMREWGEASCLNRVVAARAGRSWPPRSQWFFLKGRDE